MSPSRGYIGDRYYLVNAQYEHTTELLRLLRFISPRTMSSVSASPSHWLSECLCDLMASPHIAMPPHGGMHLGPGPVDVFTTRFNQYFTSTAHGSICGHPVDREGLKESLLALQKRWNPEDLRIEQEGLNGRCSLQHDVVRSVPRTAMVLTMLILYDSLAPKLNGLRLATVFRR